jgi:arabinofuranosyltransferase
VARPSRQRPWALPLLLALGVVAPCALQAWVSDDAFITLRVVDNVVEGRGAVWNTGQRVQVYTHPAWFVLEVAVIGVTREYFLTPMLLGLTLTFAFVLGLAWHAREAPWRAVFVAALLAGSPSFTDFATSGLENPLTHLWLLLAALEATRSDVRLGRLALFAGLLQLTRPDGVLLMVPLVALHALRTMSAEGAVITAKRLLLAGLPVLAWYAFALVYYGTPVANTALAKLGAQLPARHTWPVGLHYLQLLVTRDPAAVVLILAGTWAAIARFRRRRTHPGGGSAAAWLVGITLHTTYVVSIGGDFMLGRFWTPWVALSAILVVTAPTPWPLTARRARVTRALATLGVLGAHVGVFLLHAHPCRPEPTTQELLDFSYGVYDERAFYRADLSIQAWFDGRGPGTFGSGAHARRIAEEVRASGQRRVMEGAQAGFFGFYAGPDVHLLDPFALADPLLSRLPAFRMPRFRAGHLPRPIPPGYVESERTGEDHFQDPVLGRLWQRVRLLTNGPLFTRERWEAIAWLLTHDATEGLDVDRYLLWHATHATPATLVHGRVPVRDMGIHVDLGRVQRAETIMVYLDPPDRRELWFYRGTQRLAEVVAPEGNAPFPVPEAARAGFDRVVVLPRDHYRPDARWLDRVALDGVPLSAAGEPPAR